MSVKTDERILYELFQNISSRHASKDQKYKNHADDKRIFDGITSKISLLTMRLNEEGLVSIVDIRKNLTKAKSHFIQLSTIRGRHPEYFSDAIDKQIDEMLTGICKQEAEMISGLRMQETGGERIDIREVFSKKKNLSQLGSQFARDIIVSEISEEKFRSRHISTYFITDTGKKYHREDCPFCKGRHLSEVTKSMVESQKLTPCKCLSPSEDSYDPSYMTAFIDESIHPVAWDENGHKGKEGSYSYIICRGLIHDENEIRDGRVLAKGVDFIGETRRVHRVTEAAVGKVLISLLYDHGFDGNVQIFTDNQSVASSWKSVATNSRLAKEFKSVRVSYIPRGMNKKADRLGRSRVLLDIPEKTYRELVRRGDRIKELEKKVKEAEEQIRILREQEGVIVVKKMEYLSTA